MGDEGEMEISLRVKGSGHHEWRSHELCPRTFTSGETSSSFSFLKQHSYSCISSVYIFPLKVFVFDQQSIKGNFPTAALCCKMHTVFDMECGIKSRAGIQIFTFSFSLSFSSSPFYSFTFTNTSKLTYHRLGNISL